MNITKILKDYNLEPTLTKRLNEGKINETYLIKTKKEEYILQYLQYDEWSKKQLNTEVKVLNYLNKHKFKYEIPIPITNKNGKIIQKKNGRLFWLYKKVKGKTIKRYNLHEFVQEAEALASYHLTIEDLKIKKHSDFMDSYTIKKLDEIKEIYPRTKLDKIAKRYAGFFKEIYKKLERIEFVDFLMTHSDFNNGNLLFVKDKLNGIIDFHNVDYAPVSKDLAIAIRRTNYITKGFNLQKMNIFLRHYQKFRKLNKKEIKTIIPALLLENATTFWWMYLEYGGSYIEKKKSIERLIIESKKYYKKI